MNNMGNGNMKRAIIIHGMPSKEEYFGPEGTSQSGKHWLGWLKAELIKNGVEAVAPEMPDSYEPVYERWCLVFEQHPIDENTMLIGHSIGAGFMVRWLSENKTKVGKVVLVAPWIDPTHELRNGFFDFEIDKELVVRTDGMTIFISSDDGQEMLESVKKIKSTFSKIVVREFSSHGHFTFGDMGTHEFPELLEMLL